MYDPLPLRHQFEAARALFFQGRYSAAEQAFRSLLALAPDHPDALHYLGVIAYLDHNYERAELLVRRAQPRRRNDTELHANLALILQARGNFEGAQKSMRRAVALVPTSAEYHATLATMLRDCGRLAEALGECDRAIALNQNNPLAHFTRAICKLLRGPSRDAWRDHQWRVPAEHAGSAIMNPAAPDEAIPTPATWLNLDLSAQRILVAYEQGIGDEIFFLRFAPALRRRCAWLGYLASSARMAELLGRVHGIDEVLVQAPGRDAIDRVLLVGDLPLAALASDDAYPHPLRLEPPLAAFEAARALLEAAGPSPFLGVTWRAGATPTAGGMPRRRKSVPLPSLGRAIAAWPGTIVSLQRHPQVDETGELSACAGRSVVDLSALNDDLQVMLAAMYEIDDYVGVSNVNMHLRAAAGRAARVLVPAPPDWRWLAAGERSPWFDGFELYRETRSNGWEPALLRLSKELRS